MPAADALPPLLAGLRHPWPPANRHAAEALVALDARLAVNDLVRELDAPDPAAPFEVDQNGERVASVRELVRVNHHGNCLLCHAPSFDLKDPVRGPVPNPYRPLPVRAVYYGDRSRTGDLMVRADVTYLRQDFSEVLTVDDPGPWPKEQRFDFLVRTRRLSEEEAQLWRDRDRLVGPTALSSAREATLFALRGLTGRDAAPNSAAWEQTLAGRRNASRPK